MKKKMWLKSLVLGAIIAVCTPKIYAASILNYNNFSYANTKYKILVDGQTYTMPTKYKYENGYELDLSTYNERIQSSNLPNLKYENGKLTYTGGMFNATVSDEYSVFYNQVGSMNSTLTEQKVKNGLLKYQFLPSRILSKKNVEEDLKSTTLTDAQRAELNFKLQTYNEDIQMASSLQVDGSQKDILATLPYLGQIGNITDSLKFEGTTLTSITSNINLNYYVYSMIFRDLRLFTLKYSTNGNDYVSVPSFDKDTYTYTVKLPSTVADNATITTQSEGYMQKQINGSSMASIESGLEISEANVKLNNGMAQAKVTQTFNIPKVYGSYIDPEVTTNPTRTYTIYFTKYDYLKGDINRDGKINADDAADAIEIFKTNAQTEENIKVGDMDGNGTVNAEDSALIIEYFKTHH